MLRSRHSDYKVVSPALRAVGNIVTGDDLQTQVMAACTCAHLLSRQRSNAKTTMCERGCPGNFKLFSATVPTSTP